MAQKCRDSRDEPGHGIFHPFAGDLRFWSFLDTFEKVLINAVPVPESEGLNLLADGRIMDQQGIEAQQFLQGIEVAEAGFLR